MEIVNLFYFILNSNKPTGEKFPFRQMLLNFPNTHTFSCSTNVVAACPSYSLSLLPLPEKETPLVTFKMFIYPCSTFICQKATAVSSINSSFCTAGDQQHWSSLKYYVGNRQIRAQTRTRIRMQDTACVKLYALLNYNAKILSSILAAKCNYITELVTF